MSHKPPLRLWPAELSGLGPLKTTIAGHPPDFLGDCDLEGNLCDVYSDDCMLLHGLLLFLCPKGDFGT